MSLPENLNLETLSYFIKVADLSNFTQAAQELYISQPTLSKHIKELECHLGRQLFLRTKKGVVMTQDGQRFYEMCISFLTAYRNFSNSVFQQNHKSALQGLLSICYQRPVRNIIRGINASFLQKYPHVQIKCELLSNSNPLDALVSGVADCVYVYQSEYFRMKQKDFTAFPVCHFNWVVVMSTQNPLAKKSFVRMEDLKEQFFVIIERAVSPANFDEIYSACYQANFIPKVVKFTHDVDNIITYVSMLDAVAIMSENTYNFSNQENVVYRPIRDYPFPYISYLTALTDRVNPTVEGYFSYVRSQLSGSSIFSPENAVICSS